MKDLLKGQLLTYSKKTISVGELDQLVSFGNLSYDEFANLILSLEQENILEMIKSKGRNNRNPSIAYSYRVQKQPLKEAYHEELKRHRLTLNSSIHLDSYFGLDPSKWKQDLPYLQLIHSYLQRFGFPDQEVPDPERSVELVGDEKWISEKAGKELLERVGLWTAMKVMPVSDPLMFAVNPANLNKSEQKHLIVENKTTYQALMDVLPDTEFSSLIYGSGNKIIKSIEQFERQLPLPGVTHEFYYFGDIDRSGIFIWHRLNEKRPMKLALPFYEACMDKSALKGKINQRLDQASLEVFLSKFTKSRQEQLKHVLENGSYYPQEILKTSELQDIWRQGLWT